MLLVISSLFTLTASLYTQAFQLLLTLNVFKLAYPDATLSSLNCLAHHQAALERVLMSALGAASSRGAVLFVDEVEDLLRSRFRWALRKGPADELPGEASRLLASLDGLMSATFSLVGGVGLQTCWRVVGSSSRSPSCSILA